jgi:hypothetical protein
MPTENISNIRHEARIHKAALAESMFGIVGALTKESNIISDLLLQEAHDYSNIVGFGYGPKQELGFSSGESSEMAVRIYIQDNKKPLQITVPKSILDRPVEIVETGMIHALARPTECGVSIGHYSITVGTLGCIARRNNDTAQYILSNNHVLANTNKGSLGDSILEPGSMDLGDPADPIARLTAFVPIKFGINQVNEVDVAIAALLDFTHVRPVIKIIGQIGSPSAQPFIGQRVHKHGRTTGLTQGVVDDISADFKVHYRGVGIAKFIDQIAIKGVGGKFSDGGDSGSLILEEASNAPVGLLFAGGTTLAFANYIDLALSEISAIIIT